MDTLHPVLESRGFFWDAKEHRATAQQYSRSDAALNADRWRASPFYHMQQSGLWELQVGLETTPSEDFPILAELRELGHSGYLAMIHPLSGDDAIGEMDTLYSRWSTARPGGFAPQEVEAFRKLLPGLALAIKAASFRRITQSLVSVYLGRDPGRLVLEGRIARGTVESINTVLWYSDMANYTALSEQVSSNELISLLNAYAETAIVSICENGGDVLKLVGDGTLAIFNAPSLAEAAEAALAARRVLAQRLERLNDERAAKGQATTTIYLSLHVGEVFYGNIGSDERLDFTVIGPAVNEVCRIASVSTTVGGSLLVSSEFLALLPDEVRVRFADAGVHSLKGVREPKQLYAEILESG
ncbi:adenylate/guanylate cyclase domain-containing protein [Rhizobium grahamii]|uniref:adenylate/guanylate cyclase domain-containing protein n=1 Tax=Rhizobium grahamii TaxID=1120045 RepID=UPI001FD490AF|nr:adenylate/guanylate cyclase domain-containing protein [Rhizobium grahamii]